MAVKKGLWTDNNTGDILYPQTSGDMIEQDSNHRLVTDVEKNTWNGKANASHSHNYAGSNSAGGAATTALACTGNSATATKATQDSSGQQINSTYIKSLSVSGRTITYTKGNGATGTITTQDTNTTYNVATSSANGLMSSADKAKLDGVATGANKYTHPSTHPATVITEDSSHRFVTDEEKNNWNNLQRDNLLINSDFRFGVINQRGQSTYGATNSWKYSIDRWCYFGQMSVVVNSGSVTFQANSSNSGYSYVKQIFPVTYSGTFTLNVRIKEISGNVRINGINQVLKVGDNIVTFTTDLTNLQFNLYGTNAKMTVEYIKIEEGNVFTGIGNYNYSFELLKCQRYYEVGTFTIPVVNSETSHYQFKIDKRINPNVSFANKKVGLEGISGMVDSSYVVFKSATTRGMNFTQNKYSGIYWFACDYFADAEIY